MEKITEIERKLKQKLSPKVFNKLAKQTQFIQRARKTEGFDIFWSIISGFVIGQATEIAGMLRAFIKDTDMPINYSAWYNRLAKAGFAEFMREAATYLINHMYTQHLATEGLLKQFDDIHIQDGSSLAINDLLKKIFPGRFTKTSPAAIELHVYFSLRYGSFHGVALAPDTVSEYKFMPKPREYQLTNTLSLFDRGYNSIDHLYVIEEANGYFMVRMKDNMNPTVLWANHQDQRKDSYFRNKPLQKIKLNRKENYDFNVVFDKKNGSATCVSLPYGIL
jgi:Transposase DDE domain